MYENRMENKFEYYFSGQNYLSLLPLMSIFINKTRMRMKNKTLLFYIALILLLHSTAQPQQQNEYVDKIIKEVQENFAPDRRVAIFDLSYTIENETLFLKGETNMQESLDEVLDKLKGTGFQIESEVELLPSEELKDKIYAVVNISVCNMRSDRRHAAELSTQSLLGTPLRVYKREGSWFYVQTPDDYLGWVDPGGITLKNEEELNKWIQSEKVIYTYDFGFAYSQPESKSKRVSDIVAGNIFQFIEENDNYFKVLFPDGREGFISKDESKLYNDWVKSLNPVKENIIKTSERFFGVPYLWGGTSAKGMDCSGFTKTVYYLNGIILPRDASQQVHVGELIPTEDGFDKLQPGDLLFFGSKATEERRERITHVAIYLGDMDFIHADGKIRVNSLDKDKEHFSQYRYNSFIRAKRILSSLGENGIQLVKDSKFYH